MENLIFIKKPTKKEKYGNKPKQDQMQRLSNMYNGKIVFMPYGKNGCGFYLIPKNN